MKIPTLFGISLYTGMKHRTAKKYIRHFWRNAFRSEQAYHGWFTDMANKGNGSLVCACRGLNERIKNATPAYLSIHGDGRVLVDVDFEMESGMNCSATHCGVSSPISYDDAMRYAAFIRNTPSAKMYGFDVRYSPEVMTIHSDGTYTINYELENNLQKEQ